MDLLIEKIPVNRLIVVITTCLTNNNNLSHAVHWMAASDNLSVLYLVLVSEKDNLLEVSRNMATMKAVTSANRLMVDVKTIKISNWLENLQRITVPGDVVVCQEEQTIYSGALKLIPLNEFLSNQINIPVRTMSGVYHPVKLLAKKWLREFIILIVFVTITVGFTMLQFHINQALDGWIRNLYIVITLCFEVYAIWAWNKFVSR